MCAIDTAAEVHERPLFVLKQALQERFVFPNSAGVIHYHGVRGFNNTACDAVMYIGAPHPDVAGLRREAGLLVGSVEHSTRRHASNPPFYRTIYYADADGQGRAVPINHFTGPVGALFRDAREKVLE